MIAIKPERTRQPFAWVRCGLRIRAETPINRRSKRQSRGTCHASQSVDGNSSELESGDQRKPFCKQRPKHRSKLGRDAVIDGWRAPLAIADRNQVETVTLRPSTSRGPNDAVFRTQMLEAICHS